MHRDAASPKPNGSTGCPDDRPGRRPSELADFADRRVITYSGGQAAVTRQQAKAGLGLLGISGRPDDAAVIVWLGLIEELTLYSVVALKNLLPEADLALCDLAQQVNGRGRIHCVYRLKDSTLPEVRHWLLHGGYQNGVMTEEVAYIAATADDLRAALDTEPDDEILDHAGALLEPSWV